MKLASVGWGCALTAFACAVASGCGGDEDRGSVSCVEGTEGCSCYGNGTCDDGLGCVSGYCVPSTSTAGGSGGGSGNGSGGTVEDSPSDLSGTWDAIGSRIGRTPSTATITINPDRLEILAEGHLLVAVRSGDTFEITYTQGSRTERLLGTRTTAGSSSLGDLPLDLSGGRRLINNPPNLGGSCESQLGRAQLTASCQGVSWAPRMLRSFRNGSVTGERIAAMSSRFGDLGGVWDLEASGGGFCLVVFEGQRFRAQCSGDGYVEGSLEAEFQGTIMSGRTSGGIEFSAQRR